MLPKEKEVELPLLQTLAELGGKGKTKDIYPLVTKKFPKISEDDLIEELPSGGKKWYNRIQWVRLRLIHEGEMSSVARGIWAITEKGRQRLKKKVNVKSVAAQKENFTELYEEYVKEFRSQLLLTLDELTPRQFELFGRKLLEAYGFNEVTVTSLAADGGIDGYGKLRLGLASMNAAFQCKRWKGNVSRREVDRFRGAIQGEFEQGVFFVTSDFTSQARKASLKKGAVPVILLNGEKIVNIMIEKDIGVQKEPMFLYYDRSLNLVEEE